MQINRCCVILDTPSQTTSEQTFPIQQVYKTFSRLAAPTRQVTLRTLHWSSVLWTKGGIANVVKYYIIFDCKRKINYYYYYYTQPKIPQSSSSSMLGWKNRFPHKGLIHIRRGSIGYIFLKKKGQLFQRLKVGISIFRCKNTANIKQMFLPKTFLL